MKILLSALLCLISSFSFSSINLWQISNGENTLYLHGTVHALPATAWPMNELILAKFDQADEVWFEIADIEDPKAAILMLEAAKQNTPLKNQLTEQNYQALARYFERQDLPIAAFDYYAPWFISVQIIMQEFAKYGFHSEFGVDIRLQRRAKAAQQNIKGFESIEFQLAMFQTLGNNPNLIIEQTLSDLEQLPELNKHLAPLWKTGDLQAIEKHFVEPMNDYPAIADAMLYQRNHAWLVQLETLLATTPTEFIAVGAAHLSGDEGLIVLLKAKDYQVTQYQ